MEFWLALKTTAVVLSVLQSTDAFKPEIRIHCQDEASHTSLPGRRAQELTSISEPRPAADLTFSAEERDAITTFERRSGDGGVLTSGLEHALFWLDGEYRPSRGIRATADVPAGKAVVQLPRSQAICLNEDERSPFPQWIPEKQWQKLPWYAKLGLKLIQERVTSGSPLKSSYAALIPPPGALQTPYHWSDRHVEQLRGVYPALVLRLDRQRTAWSELYASLGKTRAVREGLDEETFVWALESVLSRSFKGTFGTSVLSVLPSLGLVALLAVLYIIDQQTTQVFTYFSDEYPQAGLIPAALFLLPLILGLFRSKATYILAPMVDSLNHKTSIATDLDYESIQQRFNLKLGRSFQRGEQIFMSYGAKSNDDLLLYYGFVEEDNPADTVELADVVHDLTEAYGTMVMEDRIQTLFSKGLQDAVNSCKIARKGKVDEKAIEGLRILLASDEELQAENEITESIIQTPMFLTLDEFEDSVFSKELPSMTERTVYEALLTLCQRQRRKIILTVEEERMLREAKFSRGAALKSSDSTQLLIFAFRKEKIRVLDEAIARFSRLVQRYKPR